MSYYHYCQAEVSFSLRREALGRTAASDELYAAFNELLDFYGKTSFDDEKTENMEDVTVVLVTGSSAGSANRAPDGRIYAPLWQRVRVSAQGDISGAIAVVLAATCLRLSTAKHFVVNPGCFVLTNADTLKTRRFPYGKTSQERKDAVLQSCLSEFMDNIEGTLSTKRQKALYRDLRSACLKATTSQRKL